MEWSAGTPESVIYSTNHGPNGSIALSIVDLSQPKVVFSLLTPLYASPYSPVTVVPASAISGR